MTTRNLALSILAFCAVLHSGCSSPSSIEPGTWKLRVIGHQFSRDTSDAESLDRELMPWTLVDVKLDWRDDPTHGTLQTVEIRSADPTRESLPPITGVIGPIEADDSALYLDVHNLRDGDKGDDVEFRLQGAIRESDFIKGEVVGRKRLRKTEGFRGRFELVHLNEEQALVERHGLEREIRARDKLQAQNRRPKPEADRPARQPEPRPEDLEDVAQKRLPMTPGIWVLEIDGRDLTSASDDFEPLLKPTKVYVHVDASQESDDLPVEIHFTRGKAEGEFDSTLQPITGALRADDDDPGDYDLNVQGRDLPIGKLGYDFRMKSRKLSPNKVEGLVLLRDSQTGRRGYEGHFTMRRTK
jgi:hypothetical protein